jgi:hypothetical protein
MQLTANKKPVNTGSMGLRMATLLRARDAGEKAGPD